MDDNRLLGQVGKDFDQLFYRLLTIPAPLSYPITYVRYSLIIYVFHLSSLIKLLSPVYVAFMYPSIFCKAQYILFNSHKIIIVGNFQS